MIAYQGLHHFHNEKSMYTEPNDICHKSKQLSRVFRGFRIGTSRLVKKQSSNYYDVLWFWFPDSLIHLSGVDPEGLR